MTKMKISNIFLCTFALLVLSSCVKDEQTEPTNVAGAEVLLGFEFKQAKDWTDISSSSQTRAASTAAEQVVNDIWVFQFDGTDENSSTLVSPPKYMDVITMGPNESLPFVDSGTDIQNIVIVANTGNPDMKWGVTVGQTTLSYIKEKTITIASEEGLMPNGGLLMFGSKATAINASTPSPLQATMSYPMARIKLGLKCTAADVEVCGIRVYNVPAVIDIFGKSGVTPTYPDETIDYLSYDYMPVSGVDATEKEFVWYMPQNLRGSAAGSTSVHDKNIYAPKLATYVTVFAKDKNTGGAITYTFYPGADMVSDCNIRSGNTYNMHINIVGHKNAIVDSRIEDLSVVSFDGDPANCYLLNPPAAGETIFRIYPSQVDVYWGQRYANEPDNMLRDDVAWKVKLLWMDEPGMVKTTTDAITLHKDGGTGYNDCFEIKVPSTSAHGNFVLALYKASDVEQTPLWSWHFWVTDYNPDVKQLHKVGGKLVYKVNSGNVYRLMNSRGKSPDLWCDGAVYENSFLMDRYVGEMVDDALYSANNRNDITKAKGSLHFQWGRKDPFPVYTGITDITGASVSIDRITTGTNSVQESIYSPMVYMRNISYAAQTLWGDKYLPVISNVVPTDNEFNNKGKSIFDPCPPGWMLPNTGTFADFEEGYTVYAPDRGLGFYQLNNDGTTTFRAVRYWPYINQNGTYPVGGRIMFVSGLYRDSVNNLGDKGGFWVNYSGRSIAIAILNIGKEVDNLSEAVNARCVSMPR